MENFCSHIKRNKRCCELEKCILEFYIGMFCKCSPAEFVHVIFVWRTINPSRYVIYMILYSVIFNLLFIKIYMLCNFEQRLWRDKRNTLSELFNKTLPCLRRLVAGLSPRCPGFVPRLDSVRFVQIKWHCDKFFLLIFSGFPCQHHSTMAFNTYVLSGGWIIGPLEAAVQRHGLDRTTWTTTRSYLSSTILFNKILAEILNDKICIT
jgi:hypothetical protein